jgi:hypothetical protein
MTTRGMTTSGACQSQVPALTGTTVNARVPASTTPPPTDTSTSTSLSSPPSYGYPIADQCTICIVNQPIPMHLSTNADTSSLHLLQYQPLNHRCLLLLHLQRQTILTRSQPHLRLCLRVPNLRLRLQVLNH